MLDQMIEKAVEKYKPGLLIAKDTTHAYATNIIQTLEQIRDNAINDEFIEIRKRYAVNIKPGLAAGVFSVPHNEQWSLENVTWSLTTAGGIALIESGQLSGGETYDPVGKVVRWAATADASLGMSGGNDVLFEGGTRILISGTSATEGVCYVQIKIKHKSPYYKALKAGRIEQKPITDPDTSTARHGREGVYQTPNPVANATH